MPCDPLVTPDCINDYPQFGGADNKVLLAQITTNGSFSGVFNLQVFNGGDQSLNEYVNGLGFSTDPNAIFGCMDPAASNYDPTATNDDYSCVLPCTLELVVESSSSNFEITSSKIGKEWDTRRHHCCLTRRMLSSRLSR